jgi:CRISPR/Cas system-associated exonuclease Cas4 (RecB family)
LRTIRASEIGSYLYCRRAWWYQRQGIESQNQSEIAIGSEMHRRHGQAVLVNSCLRAAAYILLFTGLVIITIYLVGQSL